jgi:Fe2+ transport system protein FeoA
MFNRKKPFVASSTECPKGQPAAATALEGDPTVPAAVPEQALAGPAAAVATQPELGLSLAFCANGFSGRIAALSGPAFMLERLRELGFVTGEPIALLGRAPLGEPLLVEVRGATIALRRTEAECLRV